MITVRIESVNFDPKSQMGIVILEVITLRDLEKKKIIPIWVGIFEAQAILFKLKNMYFPRPLTHDLMKNLLKELKGKVDFVLISDVSENTFYAEIHLNVDNEKITLDSRPSDAFALALRVDAPIFVSEKVYQEHSWEREKFAEFQKSSAYQKYLETSSDEEIGKA